ETLTKSFREVQSVLDLNRRLIQQANENHRSKIPRNLATSVELFREIKSNISEVVGLYSDLSESFSGIVQQRRSVAGNAAKGVESVRSQLSSNFYTLFFRQSFEFLWHFLLLSIRLITSSVCGDVGHFHNNFIIGVISSYLIIYIISWE
ncbi:protein early flowering 4, partial [Phtheirospermum japonicum]